MATSKQKKEPETLVQYRNRLREQAHKIEGRVWNGSEQELVAGESFMVGRLNQIDEGVGEFGSTMLRFSDPHGDEIAVWQKGTLKTRISQAHVGQFLMIDYQGTEPSKKKSQDPMNVYDVYLLTKEQFNEFADADELPF